MSARQRRGLRTAAVVALTAAGALGLAGVLVDALAGPAPAYTKGFAPAPVLVVAAAVGLVSLTASPASPASPRWRPQAGWAAVVLLIWSGSGVLFDLLRVAALAGLPGLPPEVDAVGFARRASSLVGALLLAGALLRGRRPPPRAFSGVLALPLALPYPALKVYWWAGGDFARAFAGSAHDFPLMEVLLFALAALWGLALVTRWGAGPTRPVLVIGGWVAAIPLVSTGSLAGFGALADLLGIVDGPFEASAQAVLVSLVYTSWLALGVALGRAAWQAGPIGRTGQAQTGLRQTET